MAFVKKTWVDRSVEHPGRVILTPTGNTNEYDVTRSEGTITSPGDLMNAANLNDLEDRLDQGVQSVVATTVEARDQVQADKLSVQATKEAVDTTAATVSSDKTAAKTYCDEAKEYRDQAAGYAGAATYSFMVDTEGFLCLHYKPDSN